MWQKRNLRVFLSLLVASSLAAIAGSGGPDAAGYTWRDSDSGATYAWEDATGGTPVPLGDDQNSTFITLPFTFTYYGANYNQIAFASNGWASFTDETSTAYTNSTIPAAALPNALIAAFWDDLYSGTAYYQTFGTSPNRRFVIEWLDFPDCCLGTNPKNTFEIVLFEGTGIIKVQYLSMNGDLASCSVGIENDLGDTGLQCLYNSTPSGGFNLRDLYAVEFLPPVLMDCTGATVVICDSTLTAQTMGTSNDITSYGCSANTYDGLERVYQLDLASSQNLDIAISNFGGDNLDLFLLNTCSPNSCVTGGADAISADYLTAGTYYVVVDGLTAADNGPFDLRIDCNATSPVTCPTSCTTILREDFAAGLPGSWTTQHNGNCTGPSSTWTDANPGARTPVAPITDPFMIVDSDDAGICDMDEQLETPLIDCTAGGPYTEIHLKYDHYFNQFGAEQGDVLVQSSATAGWQLVASYTADSPNPESVDIDITSYALGQTDLQVAFHYYNANYEMYWMVDNVEICGIPPATTSCASAQVITCPFSASDTTVGGTTEFDGYGCSPDMFAGNERIYEITVAAPTTLDIVLSGFATRDMEVALLSACDPCSCVATGTVMQETVAAGTYYIVVDGYTTADNGSYTLDVTCTDPCTIPSSISCDSTVSSDTTGQGNDLASPSCIAGGAGPDEIYRLDYPGPIGSTIWAEATPTGGWDHILYALGNCIDPASCLAGVDTGPITFTTTTSPETAYLVVDGKLAANSGSYTLETRCFSNQLDCTAPQLLSCYDVVAVDTTGGPQDVYQYGCGGAPAEPGPERVYQITTTSTGDLTASLSNLAGDDLDLYILDASCQAATCLAFGDTSATVTAAPPGTYTIVVETAKYHGAGQATLTVTCPLASGLNCAGAIPIGCNTELDGDTTTGADGQDRYSCGGQDLKGTELVYEITLASQTWLLAELSGTGSRDLDLVLLSSCDPNACVAQGDTQILQLLAPGTYDLVVDGATNVDDGPFHLEVLCIPPSTLNCGSCANPLLSEDFEGGWGPLGDNPPAGWSIIDNGDEAPPVWNNNDWHSYAYGGAQVTTARVYYSPIENQDEELITPAINCSAASGTTLQYFADYDDYSTDATDTGYVDISTDGGVSWQNLWTYQDADVIETRQIDISAIADGQPDVRVRFRYVGNNDWGFNIDDVVLCAAPPGGLDCTSPTPLTCGDNLTGQTMGAANNQTEYSCSSLTYAAKEHVYSFTLAQATTVTIDLANYGNADLSVFILSSCDSCSCIAGGGPSVTAQGLAPGTYYVVVEGYDASDDSATFDISMTCTDPCLTIPSITCNVPVSGDTSDDTNTLDPPCGSGAGPEEIHKLFVSLPVGSNLVVSMPDPGWDHTLYALTSCVDPTSCVGWVDSGNLILTTTSDPQTFYIVVDGYSAGASGAYSNLLVTCPLPNSLDCSGAIPLACNTTTSGDTIGLPNNATQYAGINGTFQGSEEIYTITLAAPTNIDIYLTNFPGRRLDLFLLDACNVNNLVDGGATEIHRNALTAGTYYLVVDGRTPADNGTYDLRFVCNPPATPPSCTYIYNVTEPATYSWRDATGGTAVTMTDDANSGFLSLPFPFAYFGTTYSQIAACSNGWASFTDGTSTTFVNAAIPDAAPPDALIAAFFDDLYASTLYYDTLGTAPNREFIIEWLDFPDCCSGTNPLNTFEIVLREGTDEILVQYQSIAGDRTSCTIGIESPSATGGYQQYYNDSPVVPALTNYAILYTPVGPSSTVDCSAPTPLPCGVTSGDTSGGGLANNVNAYGCGVDTYDGNEQVFELTITSPTMVDIALSNMGTRELDFFVLSSCDPCNCIAGGSDQASVSLQPGTYYVVVDGFSQADNGPFDFTVTCTACTDPGAHSRWSSCENPRSPITTATTSALEWNFDDCDYCRDAGNGCFSTPCTFDMYIVAECGAEMHMPLYDNETGDLQIYDMQAGQYVYLYAQSTGGWSAQGYRITWQDCSGVDPNWNNETTDIWFNGNPTLCGVYRAEFINWGGFVWDLFSNCTGTDTPGFKIYDNYCEALAAYTPQPALSVETLNVTGSCPNYTVDYSISNAGCAAASTSVVAKSDLGGWSEQLEANIQPGETRNGSLTLNVQNGGNGTITAYADFYDTVLECQEAGSSVVACSISGGSASLSQPISCGCVIPQFSTAQVEDLDCPVGIRLYWSSATFAGGTGHYDIYRSTVSFADALLNPPIATMIVANEYIDNATTPGTTYYYIVRAEDDQAAPPGCTVGPHGGLYTDINVGPITDNLSQRQDKPYDIGNDLRCLKITPTEVQHDWSTVTPDPNTTHWHVYRSTDPSLPFPDQWTLICPDKPLPGYIPANQLTWNDAAAVGTPYYYDVRSANDCEDISPKPLNVSIQSTAPSCDGSGLVAFTSLVQGGVAPYSYSWDFGDGSPPDTTANPSHAYAFPPYFYTATMTVTDSTVPTNQISSAQNVVGVGPSLTASFTYSAAGLTVTFNGTATGGTGSFAFSWDFGDGQGSAIEDPVHTYAVAGTYTVRFTVTDTNSWCRAYDSMDVTVAP